MRKKFTIIYLPCVSLLFLLLVTIIAYHSSLYYDFDTGIDDGWLVINNPGIRDLSWKGICFLFFKDKLDPFYYPLTYLSLAIDYHFFGLNPFWMKLHSLLLHLGSGCLVFLLTRKISASNYLALLTAAFFLLHPIQVENVAWVNCRRQVLVVFNSLASLYAFIRFYEFKNCKWYFLCLMFFVLALLSKFIAAVGILFFFLFQLLLTKKRFSFSHGQILSNIKIYLPFAFFIIVALVKNMQAAQYNTIVQTFYYTFPEHLTIFFHSFGFYIYQVLFPFKLAVFYPAPGHGMVFTPAYLAVSFLGVMVFVILIFLIIKRIYLFAFALALYILGIFLTADIMAVNGDLPCTLADRHFYMGSFGMFLFLALCMGKIFRNKSLQYMIAVILFFALAVITNQQLTHWENTTAILERTASICPSEEFYERLAMEYFQSGDEEKCLKALRSSETLGLNVHVNNPYYSRIDLAAIYFYFKDTVRTEKIIQRAIYADLDIGIRYGTCDTEMFGNLLVGKLTKPFTGENYNSYLETRSEIIKACGAKLKKGRL